MHIFNEEIEIIKGEDIMEYPRYHLGCSGKLTFVETKIVTIVTNKKAVDKYNARAKIKQLNKDFYKCNKCNNLINVIIFPSWEGYVLMGKIRISKQEYWRIKEEYRKRQQQKELSHDT